MNNHHALQDSIREALLEIAVAWSTLGEEILEILQMGVFVSFYEAQFGQCGASGWK